MKGFVRTIKDDDVVVEDGEDDDDIQFKASSFGDELKQQTHSWDFKPIMVQMSANKKSHTISVAERIRQKLEEKKRQEQGSDNEEDGSEEDEGGSRVDEDDASGISDDDQKESRTQKQNGKSKLSQQKDIKKEEKTGADAPKRKKITRSFVSLGLSRPLLRAIEELGYPEPTPIQAAAVPLIMSGKDILGCAITGSGKTAAFLLPTLERLLHRPRDVKMIRVLVLTPTRELALQCMSVLEQLSRFAQVKTALLVGGLDSEQQQVQLKGIPDVIIATPGRLIDHMLNTEHFSLSHLDVLILDEADRLLDMGFEDEVNEIVRHCPKDRQTLLFSATLTREVEGLAGLSLVNPVKVAVDEAYNLNKALVQEFARIPKFKNEGTAYREACLLALCSRHLGKGTLIFVQQKTQARRLRMILGLSGLSVGELHGNLTQEQRVEALQSFRDGDIDYLIATDVASRGLDIAGVKVVVNFNMPTILRQYVHRVGRTARAGREGSSISFVGEGAEKKLMKEILAKCSNMGAIRNRVIDTDAVEACTQIIEGMENDITSLLEDERLQRAITYAEMDTKKAEEMLNEETHKWFQTDEEHKHKRKLVKQVANGTVAKPGKDKDKNKKGKDKEDKGKKRKRGGEDEEEEKDTGDYARRVARSYKKKVRAGVIDERAERIKALRERKRGRKKEKISNFEKQLKAIETETPLTGKKRSKKSFKSAKKHKRR